MPPALVASNARTGRAASTPPRRLTAAADRCAAVEPEGRVLHSALSTDPMDEAHIRHAIERFTR